MLCQLSYNGIMYRREGLNLQQPKTAAALPIELQHHAPRPRHPEDSPAPLIPVLSGCEGRHPLTRTTNWHEKGEALPSPSVPRYHDTTVGTMITMIFRKFLQALPIPAFINSSFSAGLYRPARCRMSYAFFSLNVFHSIVATACFISLW